jgi:hypothetical protein
MMSRMVPMVLVGLVALAGCTTTGTIDGDQVEGQIAAELESQAGVAPAAVNCPDEISAEPGTTFRCSAVADDGSEAQISGTVGEGGNYSWEVTSTG